MASDPLIGLLSDRLATPLGRRRPWLLAGAPLVMVSAGYLFLPGPDAGGGGLLDNDIARIAALVWVGIFALMPLFNRDNLRVGDMVGFGISHPCTTFDKWDVMAVVDDDYNVVSAIKTFF